MTNHLEIIRDMLARKKGAKERARQYLIAADVNTSGKKVEVYF